MSSISGESITEEEIGDHDDSCKKRSANRTAYKMVLEKCAAWECRPQEDTYSRRRIKRLSRQLASESRLKYGKFYVSHIHLMEMPTICSQEFAP